MLCNAKCDADAHSTRTPSIWHQNNQMQGPITDRCASGGALGHPPTSGCSHPGRPFCAWGQASVSATLSAIRVIQRQYRTRDHGSPRTDGPLPLALICNVPRPLRDDTTAIRASRRLLSSEGRAPNSMEHTMRSKRRRVPRDALRDSSDLAMPKDGSRTVGIAAAGLAGGQRAADSRFVRLSSS